MYAYRLEGCTPIVRGCTLILCHLTKDKVEGSSPVHTHQTTKAYGSWVGRKLA